jgi:DNA-3-methyladenine glycosylase
VKLPRSFYERPTLDVTRDLLGKVLVHRRGSTITSGAIVEVEAYVGEGDPACHASAGRTRRNEPLYGPPGFAYVYLNYGVHYLVNAVTEEEGSPAAVLIRALDPLDGVGAMRQRRARAGPAGLSSARDRRSGGLAYRTHDLCRGPGNLTRAMGITLDENRVDLTSDRVFIEDRGLRPRPIVWGPRIGITVGTERLWRAWIEGHPAVSAKTTRRGVRLPSPLQVVGRLTTRGEESTT